MATIKLGTYQNSVQVLASELNSLANNNVSSPSGFGTGTVFDNTSNLYPFADVELILMFGTAPTAGNAINLHVYDSVDGTNYENPRSTGATEGEDAPWGTVAIVGTTTMQRLHIARLPLTPGKLKFAVYNASGQAFSSSGSVVGVWPYALTSA